MSRIEKLLAKPKIVEISGEQLEIFPLTVENLDIIFDMEKEDKRVSAFNKLIKLTMKKAIPEATDAEIQGISMEYFEPIINAIVEVNGLADDKSTAIKERLAQQRALKGKDISN